MNQVIGLDNTDFEVINEPQDVWEKGEHRHCNITWQKPPVFNALSETPETPTDSPDKTEEITPKATPAIIVPDNGVALVVPEAPAYVPSFQDDVQTIKSASARLATVALEREDAIRALWLSLVARQHMVMYGEGGTGKSWLVKHFAEMLEMEYFYYQIFQATTENHLMGSIDYKKMHDTGEMTHVRYHSLLEAEIAFLDEIGNSSGVIRNMLKSPMEERIYKDGYEVVQMPLNSIIGASNSIIEYKKDATEAAFADRWLSRVHIQRLQRPENRKKLVTLRYEKREWPTIGADVIYRLQGYMDRVEISQAVIDAADSMRVEILADPAAGNLDMSDRRFEHTMELVRANAIIHGRLKAKRSDLIVFGLTAWNNHEEGEDTKLAEWLKAKLVSQLDKIESLESTIDEAYQAWEASTSDSGEISFDPAEKMASGQVAQRQIARLGESLKRIRPNLEDEDEVDAANKLEIKINGYNRQILYSIADIAANSGTEDAADAAIANLKK